LREKGIDISFFSRLLSINIYKTGLVNVASTESCSTISFNCVSLTTEEAVDNGGDFNNVFNFILIVVVDDEVVIASAGCCCCCCCCCCLFFSLIACWIEEFPFPDEFNCDFPLEADTIVAVDIEMADLLIGMTTSSSYSWEFG